MCKCKQIRADLRSALKRGALITAAKTATRGLAELAAHAQRAAARPPAVTKSIRGR